MKRRTFLIGTGSTAIGGSALLGSGAFTRVESQRRVKIQVAHDKDAYLGLDGCPDSPNRSYTDFQDGHLAIEMSPENPTDADGMGVNSDSRTWFDDVFQICNQGKEKACVWIADDENWPVVPENYDDAGDRRVEFYVENEPYRSIIGADNAVGLEVGECVCVGIRTNTKGLSEDDQLLDDLDNEIVINADVDEDCVQAIPEEEFTAFQVDLAWGNPLALLDSEAEPPLTYSTQERLLVWQHGEADNAARGAGALAGENGNRFGDAGSTLDFDQFFEEVKHVKFFDAGGNTVLEWDGTPGDAGAFASLGSEPPVEAEIEFEMVDDVSGKAETLWNELDDRDDLTDNEERAKAALREDDNFGVQVTWTSYGGDEFGWNPPEEFQLLWSETTMFKDNGTKTMSVDLPPLQ